MDVTKAHQPFLYSRFVYLGPKGTSTVLHADVLRSFSWSTNVCGCKRWYLVPPERTHLLYDCFGTELARHLHADGAGHGGGNLLAALFPGLAQARRHAVAVVQRAGETIFVPSRWFHTVENLQDTLSVNHNWINGANVRDCWRHVHAEVQLLLGSQAHDAALPTPDGNAVATTEPAGSAQVDHDVLLLWRVVSTKAKTLLDRDDPLAATPDRAGPDPTAGSDLESILFVLDGLLALLLEEGAAAPSALAATRTACETDHAAAALRTAVVTALAAARGMGAQRPR